MKKVIGIVMAILIILFVICNIIFFNIFGNNKYDLQNISDSQKKEIIELLNCTEILNDIDFFKFQKHIEIYTIKYILKQITKI